MKRGGWNPSKMGGPVDCLKKQNLFSHFLQLVHYALARNYFKRIANTNFVPKPKIQFAMPTKQ